MRPDGGRGLNPCGPGFGGFRRKTSFHFRRSRDAIGPVHVPALAPVYAAAARWRSGAECVAARFCSRGVRAPHRPELSFFVGVETGRRR
jgi:hypothetical protein